MPVGMHRGMGLVGGPKRMGRLFPVVMEVKMRLPRRLVPVGMNVREDRPLFHRTIEGIPRGFRNRSGAEL